MTKDSYLVECPWMSNVNSIALHLKHGSLFNSIVARKHIIDHVVALLKIYCS